MVDRLVAVSVGRYRVTTSGRGEEVPEDYETRSLPDAICTAALRMECTEAEVERAVRATLDSLRV
jgi:hypothetical protein